MARARGDHRQAEPQLMLARLLARAGLVTREQRAWAWYDCGNSAYFTTVITAVFPPFFASYAASGMSAAEATARFGVTTTVAMAIVAVTAPVLGAYGDFTARRKPLLLLFAALGIVATFLLTTITEGGWQWAAAIFILGNLGVSGSLVFYDSLLPSVARAEETDRVSSAGYALGYLGGGVLLVLNLAWILSPATFGLPSTVAATKLAFASVGVWWLLFLLPLLRDVPEPRRLAGDREAAGHSPVRATFSRLAQTFAEIRQYRQAFLALLAMLVYQDGIQTIIRFAGIYGAEIGVGQSAQIAAFAMVQLLGVPFAFLFGSFGRRWGTRRAIFLALAVYTVAASLGYFMRTTTHFFILAALVATVQGGAQALSRSLFARLIPPAKTSEYFGFYAVVERFATVLGPLVFTLSVVLTGSSRAAVLGMIAFFVVGGWLLSHVDVEEGERVAAAAR